MRILQHSNVMSLVGGIVHGFANPTVFILVFSYMEEGSLMGTLFVSDVKRAKKKRERQRMKLEELSSRCR